MITNIISTLGIFGWSEGTADYDVGLTIWACVCCGNFCFHKNSEARTYVIVHVHVHTCTCVCVGGWVGVGMCMHAHVCMHAFHPHVNFTVNCKTNFLANMYCPNWDNTLILDYWYYACDPLLANTVADIFLQSTWKLKTAFALNWSFAMGLFVYTLAVVPQIEPEAKRMVIF